MNDNVKCLIDNTVDTALSSSNVSEISICVDGSAELFMAAGEVISRLKENYQSPMPYWLESYNNPDGENEVYLFEYGMLTFFFNINKPMSCVDAEKRTGSYGEKSNQVKVCIFSSSIFPNYNACDSETLFLDLRAVDFIHGSHVDEQ